MQVIADGIKNADAILGEALSLLDVSKALCDAYLPYNLWLRTSKMRKSPPVYVAETGRKLKENFIEDFKTAYPVLASGVVNGALGTASYRINDAVYRLGSCLIKTKERKFMIMSDDERTSLHENMRDVIADIAVFTIVTFNLHRAAADICTLSISKVCERKQVSPSILYGELLQTMSDVGRTYYAYEQLSPYYTELVAAEPIFLAECEEQELPLTEELAQRILDGEITVAHAMEYLTRSTKAGGAGGGGPEVEVDVNPFTLISRMNLE